MNFSHARPLLPNLWVIPDFFSDFNKVRSAYRSPGQGWKTEYPNRLLTPWGSNPFLESILETSLFQLSELIQTSVRKQVCYASLDLSESQIMMHRLHCNIKCFVQVFTGDINDNKLNSCFCIDDKLNHDHPDDYCNLADFPPGKIIEIDYVPNTAWVLLNSPRIFFGTRNSVPKNQIRETLNLHFSDILETTT